MKVRCKPPALVLIVLCTPIWLLLSGCEMLWFYEKEWELEGEAQFTSAVANDVKFAAFYINTPGGNLTPSTPCVSNVINLEDQASTAVSFSLEIDMSAYEPNDGDEVHLYMWEDSGANSNAYDDGENKSISIPNTGCTVFNSSSLAVFFFFKGNEDYEDGWYVNAPGGITAVEDATLTGAQIINNSGL